MPSRAPVTLKMRLRDRWHHNWKRRAYTEMSPTDFWRLGVRIASVSYRLLASRF